MNYFILDNIEEDECNSQTKNKKLSIPGIICRPVMVPARHNMRGPNVPPRH